MKQFFRSFRDINVQEAARRLAELTVLDVREVEELSGELGRIASSHHVPLGDLLHGKLPSSIQPNAPLLVVCRSGGRSARAAQALAARGFTRVHNLTGGMIAWNERGFPTAPAPRDLASIARGLK